MPQAHIGTVHAKAAVRPLQDVAGVRTGLKRIDNLTVSNVTLVIVLGMSSLLKTPTACTLYHNSATLLCQCR